MYICSGIEKGKYSGTQVCASCWRMALPDRMGRLSQGTEGESSPPVYIKDLLKEEDSKEVEE